MFQFTEVGVCPHSIAEQLEEGDPSNPKKVVKGDLSLLIEIYTGLLLVKMDDFEYGFNPNDQILYEDQDPDFKVVLCLDADPDNCWFLKINQNVNLLLFVLGERCKLIHQNAAKILIRQTQSVIIGNEGEDNMEFMSQSQRKHRRKKQTEKMLIEASKKLSKCLISAGKFLSKGLDKLANILSKKIQPHEAVKVSEQSRQIIRKSFNTSDKVLSFTTDQISALFRIAKKEVQKIVQKFQVPEKEEELLEEGKLPIVQGEAITGLHVISNTEESQTQGIGATGSLIEEEGQDEAKLPADHQKKDKEAYGVIQVAKNVFRIIKSKKDKHCSKKSEQK